MNASKLLILGWLARVTPDGLYQKDVEFMTDYGIELLRYYTNEGNYISDSPFGIGKKDDTLHLIYECEPSFLSISTNPIFSELESNEDIDPSAFSTFVATNIHKRLTEAGYERPVDVRSFLGKVKGLCRCHKSDTMRFEHTFVGSHLSFVAKEAEKFTAVDLIDNDVLVLYSPRHEISEDLYGLSLRSVIPDSITEDPKLKRTPQNTMNRFDFISSLIVNQLGKRIGIQKLSSFPHNRLNRPSLRFPNGNTINLEENGSLTYEEVMRTEFSWKTNAPISIVFDETGASSSISAVVKSFGNEISNAIGTEVSYIPLRETGDHGFSNGSIVILVIDDITHGFHLIYDHIKSIPDLTSKVIRLSTLINEGVQETTKLVSLAIRFRSSGELYQKITGMENQKTIGVSIIPYRRGNYLLLTGSLLSNNKLVQAYDLLWNDRDTGIPTDDQVSNLMESLGATKNMSNLVIFTNDSTNLLGNLVSIYEGNDVPIIYISDIDSIVLNEEEGSLSIPHDGCYTKIDQNKALLMTYGFPDIRQGVPSPIYIEGVRNIHTDFDVIMKRIFYETFIHPSSFAKPKLPLSLHTSSSFRLPESRIFKEIREVGSFA